MLVAGPLAGLTPCGTGHFISSDKFCSFLMGWLPRSYGAFAFYGFYRASKYSRILRRHRLRLLPRPFHPVFNRLRDFALPGTHLVHKPRAMSSHSRRIRLPSEPAAGPGMLYHSMSSTLPQRSQMK